MEKNEEDFKYTLSCLPCDDALVLLPAFGFPLLYFGIAFIPWARSQLSRFKIDHVLHGAFEILDSSFGV